MMKRIVSFFVVLIMLTISVAAGADPARYFKKDKNQQYHSEHLMEHQGSKNCKVSANYVKVWDDPTSKKVLGHLEQADTFTIDEVEGNLVRITVTRAAKTSKDSHDGLSGWVETDYVECPCSSEEYYNGPVHMTYSIGAAVKDGVNLREEASKSSSLFATLKKGEKVEILSEYTGKDKKVWYRCRYNGKMGFIRNDMLEVVEKDIPELSDISAKNSSETDQQENVEKESPNLSYEEFKTDYDIRNKIRFTDSMAVVKSKETLNELNGSKPNVLYYGRSNLWGIDNSEIDYFFDDNDSLYGVLYHFTSFSDRKTVNDSYNKAKRYISATKGINDITDDYYDYSSYWLAQTEALSSILEFKMYGGSGDIDDQNYWVLSDLKGNRIFFCLINYHTTPVNSNKTYYYCEASLYYLESKKSQVTQKELANTIDDLSVIKDGISITDNRNSVIEKESILFIDSENQFATFGPGQAFGIDIKKVEYKFDDNNNIEYVLFNTGSIPKEKKDKVYDTIKQYLTEKYQEPLTEISIIDGVYLPAKKTAELNIKINGGNGSIVTEEYWAIPSAELVIDLVVWKLAETTFINLGFTHSTQIISENTDKTITETSSYDFKTFVWGDSRKKVVSVEGDPIYEQTVEGTSGKCISYKRTVASLEAALSYNFTNDDKLYQIGYTLIEEHTNNSMYLDDFELLKKELIKKYGAPETDMEQWNNDYDKESYKSNKGDAVKLGLLSYYVVFQTERTEIVLMMVSDNMEVTTMIIYNSNVISVPEPDYSKDL